MNHIISILLIAIFIYILSNNINKIEKFKNSCNENLISSNTCPNKSNNNFAKIMNTYEIHHPMGNHCDGYISDQQFLKHMIPHHYVAILMARKALGSSTNQEIGYLLHKIIHNQYEEIITMHAILEGFLPKMYSNDKLDRQYITNTNEHWFHDEVTDKKSQCNLKAFHMAHKVIPGEISLKDFLNHMIPHHQIAIDMSKKVLKYTKNPLIMKLAYDIIKDQQQEIWYMKGMANQYN